MTDTVERLRAQQEAAEADRPSSYVKDIWGVAADEIERLRAALQRIDGINDNPAIYNPDIEAVLRAALDEQVAQ